MWLPKLVTSRPCTADHLCRLASKSVHSFSKYLESLVVDKQTDGRTDRWTNRQVENIMRSPGKLTNLWNAGSTSIRGEDSDHHWRKCSKNDGPDDVHEVAKHVSTSASSVRHAEQFRPSVPLRTSTHASPVNSQELHSESQYHTSHSVLTFTHHIQFWYLRCCGCPGLRGRQHLATPHTRSPWIPV